jgi:hypothetical protein
MLTSPKLVSLAKVTTTSIRVNLWRGEDVGKYAGGEFSFWPQYSLKVEHYFKDQVTVSQYSGQAGEAVAVGTGVDASRMQTDAP